MYRRFQNRRTVRAEFAVYIVVDMELKGRIREALIKMILGFDIEDMNLEPEE